MGRGHGSQFYTNLRKDSEKARRRNEVTEPLYNKCMKTDEILQKYGITPEIVENFKCMAKDTARLFGMSEKQVFVDLMTQYVLRKRDEK